MLLKITEHIFIKNHPIYKTKKWKAKYGTVLHFSNLVSARRHLGSSTCLGVQFVAASHIVWLLEEQGALVRIWETER